MIKKMLAIVLMGSFLIVLSGCGTDTSPPDEPKTDQISFDTTIDYGKIDAFTQNDTFATLAAASPYYTGEQSSNVPVLQSLNEKKADKIKDAIRLTGETFAQVKELKRQLEPFKDAYLEFIGDAVKEESKLKNFALDVAKQFMQYQVAEEALIASFESITIDPTNRLAGAILEYQKTEIVLKLADTLYYDLDYLLSNSWQLQQIFQTSSKPVITTAWTKYEAQLNKLEDLDDPIAAINEKMATINFVVQQIKTVDHYSGLAALDFIQNNIADIKAKIAEIQPGAELSVEDQAFIKDYAGLFDEFSKNLKLVAQNTDKKELLDVESITMDASLVPFVSADEGTGYLDNASRALQATYRGGKKLAGLTWRGVKGTYQAAQTGVGITLDMANAVTSGYMNLAVDMYYGVSNKEINASFAKGMQKVTDNYQKGISGVAVLNTAKEYLEAPEKAAETGATNQAEKVFGQGWTSWGVGKTAGLTVDLFTTFGKGVIKLANKSSTAGDYVQGTLDVGLSFIGGSKVLGKGSQALAGSAEAAPILAEGGLNYMKTVFNKVMKKGAEEEFGALVKFKQAFGDLTKAQLDRYINLRLEAIIRQAVEGMLLESNNVLKNKFANFTKGAVNTLGENLGSWGKSYKDFVNKGITDSIKEYFTKDLEEFAKENLIKKGGRAGFNILKDYFDNIVGDGAENAVKDKIKEYIDGNNLPGALPELKDLAGKWNEGQMVMTNIEVSEAGQRQLQEEGCDFADIKKEQGKVNSMAMSLLPTSDHGGTMSLRMGDGKTETVPFTYEDGVITATSEKDGVKVNIHMNVTQEDNAYKVSGPIEINYKDNLIKMTGTTGSSKIIPSPTTP